MFTYRQAIRMTPDKIKMNAINVEIVNQRYTPDLVNNIGFHDEWEFTCYDPTTHSGEKRQVIIRLFQSIAGGGMQDRPVWVHCSCEWFTFNSEYAFALAGSSDIIDSNGDWPKIRNPGARPYLCKHLVRVFPLVLTRQADNRVIKMEDSFGEHIPHEKILLQKRIKPPVVNRFSGQSDWERRYLK